MSNCTDIYLPPSCFPPTSLPLSLTFHLHLESLHTHAGALELFVEDVLFDNDKAKLYIVVVYTKRCERRASHEMH